MTRYNLIYITYVIDVIENLLINQDRKSVK